MMTFSINRTESNATLAGYIHEPSLELPGWELRPAIIVIPGGGYQMVSDREKEPVALGFFSEGYQVFTLTYSVNEGAKNMTPLEEAAWAILTIRNRAKEWFVDVNKIAVCGFSAGGHLAASLGTLYKHEEILRRLHTTADMLRPNGMILAYPVLCSGAYAHRESFEMLIGCSYEENKAKGFSLERFIDEDTPPAFIWHTVDDTCVPVENSLLFMTELQRHKISYEAHLFESGVHGLSTCTPEVGSNHPRCAFWLPLCYAWLKDKFFKEPLLL